MSILTAMKSLSQRSLLGVLELNRLEVEDEVLASTKEAIACPSYPIITVYDLHGVPICPNHTHKNRIKQACHVQGPSEFECPFLSIFANEHAN